MKEEREREAPGRRQRNRSVRAHDAAACARGIPKQEAQGPAERIIAHPPRALDTLAREELGLNPDDPGSPVGAAVFSFGSFAIGASIPLAPFGGEAGASPLAGLLGQLSEAGPTKGGGSGFLDPRTLAGSV
jgi:hypothetical protein